MIVEAYNNTGSTITYVDLGITILAGDDENIPLEILADFIVNPSVVLDINNNDISLGDGINAHSGAEAFDFIYKYLNIIAENSKLDTLIAAIEDINMTALSNTLTDGHILVGNGADVAQDVAVTGDVTITNAGVTAIGATKVTNAMLAGSIALTKLLNLGSGYAIPYVFTPSGVGNTQTDQTGSLVSITGMSFAIAASESWVFFCWMEHGCNNTGGVDYGINGPSGMTMRVTAQGASTGIAAQTSSIMTTLSTNSVSFNTVSSQGGRAMLSGKVLASSTPGTVQIQFCAHTATQTATIYSESFGIAFRVA